MHLVHAEVILVAVEALVLLLRSSAHYPCDHRVRFAVTRREEFCEVPTIDFAGGNQSSDGGLQLLREAEGKLGVCRRLAAAMPDRRDPDRVGTRCSRWQWRMRRRSRAATRTPSPRRLRHYPDEGRGRPLPGKRGSAGVVIDHLPSGECAEQDRGGYPPGLLSGTDERDGVIVGRLPRLVGRLGSTTWSPPKTPVALPPHVETSPHAFCLSLARPSRIAATSDQTPSSSQGISQCRSRSITRSRMNPVASITRI